MTEQKKRTLKRWCPYLKERKRLMEQIFVLQKKVQRLKQHKQKIITRVKAKEKKAASIIDSAANFKPMAKELFNNELKNACAKKQAYDYSDSIKDFSFEISFYSNRAYEHIRKTCFTLPCSRTIRRNLYPIACDPGFLTGVL